MDSFGEACTDYDTAGRYLCLRSCIDCRFKARIFKAFPARSGRHSVFGERERESFSSKKERDFPVRRTKKERVQTIFTLPPMIF
jgi:hypothetical protein